MNTKDIELSVAAFFNDRQNIVVPNISWGLWIHECDILVVTKAGYAYEVEIKVSKADLKKDALKRHGHNDNRLKALYFAIPEKLKDCIDLIPNRAGIIIIKERNGYRMPNVVRKPTMNRQARSLSLDEMLKVAHLGAMRIWGLKRKIKDLKRVEE